MKYISELVYDWCISNHLCSCWHGVNAELDTKFYPIEDEL